MLAKGLLTATAALVLASPAAAGCFATLGTTLPRGVEPGERWTAQLEVRQHGIRPIPDARPTLTIENAATGERRTFAARRAKGPGRYTASVVFPWRGHWQLSGSDGFVARDGSWDCSSTHTFGSFAIGIPPAAEAPPAAPKAVPAQASAPAATVAHGPIGLWIALGSVVLALAAGLAAAAVGRFRGRLTRT